ncbi:MAG: hypothetical protein ABIP13_00415 [Tepidiformaceae bacterium]
MAARQSSTLKSARQGFSAVGTFQTSFVARTQFRAWQIATAILTRLPARAGYALASVAGTLGYYLWPRGRKAMHRNFRRVLPPASRSEIRATARRSLINYCRYLVDFMRFPALSPAEIIAAVGTPAAFHDLDRALEHGKGAVVVCLHFGNWDLGAGAVAARGYSVTVVAETFADPRLDTMVVGARTRLGMSVLKMERAGPSLIRTLQRNGLLALLIDRPLAGDGVTVRFFGQPVEVPAGPARLALRTGAAVIVAAFPRIAPNRLDVETLTDFAIPLPAGRSAADVQQLTQSIMDSAERFIRQHPDQWYMFREMWPRTPKGAS